MFTVELNVNGSLVGHVYGRNIEKLDGDVYRYNYEYYEAETGKIVKGSVNHQRKDGLKALAVSILEKV